jgi:hypothetical protein
MSDLLEWVNFVLSLVGAVGTVGIVVLVYQWYVDNLKPWPYVVQFRDLQAQHMGKATIILRIFNRTTWAAFFTSRFLLSMKNPAANRPPDWTWDYATEQRVKGYMRVEPKIWAEFIVQSRPTTRDPEWLPRGVQVFEASHRISPGAHYLFPWKWDPREIIETDPPGQIAPDVRKRMWV